MVDFGSSGTPTPDRFGGSARDRQAAIWVDRALEARSASRFRRCGRLNSLADANPAAPDMIKYDPFGTGPWGPVLVDVVGLNLR